MVADKTDEIPYIDDLLNKLDHPTIPLQILIPGTGPERVVHLPDAPLTQSSILDALKELESAGEGKTIASK